ncbi:hypothetical protein EV702DRAFT_1040280 [Suillus placidus]|uniref:Uncharacterized protein n=1 Tax=Suillus placidus TaxID=48579 RepID=A0A9P7A7E7_9AGAM|nr:hypothetical protein EV702DRAFT_1040280 [Suillus placidus]
MITKNTRYGINRIPCMTPVDIISIGPELEAWVAKQRTSGSGGIKESSCSTSLDPHYPPLTSGGCSTSSPMLADLANIPSQVYIHALHVWQPPQMRPKHADMSFSNLTKNSINTSPPSNSWGRCDNRGCMGDNRFGYEAAEKQRAHESVNERQQKLSAE